MPTLRRLQELNYRIWLHCASNVALCSHSWQPSWDQLIQYLGPDAELSAPETRYILNNRFVCEVCGGRGARTIIMPGADMPGMGGAGGAHRHSPPSPEVLARLRKESETVEAKLAEQLADVAMHRRQNKERDKARKAIESGKDLIGPPNPFAKIRPRMTR